MNPNERSLHPSSTQADTLIDHMERNPNLAKGFLRTASGRDNARRQWEQLSSQLNSMGGAIKTWKQWAKYWSDKKSAVKKKCMLRSAARRRTGGGNEQVAELSELEERIVSLMGGDGFFEGDRHLAIQPFHNETDNSQLPQEIVLVPQDELHEQTQDHTTCNNPEENAVQVLSNPVQSFEGAVAEVGTGSSSSTMTIFEHRRRYPEAPFATPAGPSTVPSCANSRLSPIQEAPTRRSPSPQLSSQQHTTPRRRRRLLLQPSPPSQRRTYLRSLTERFLRIEEQRLEMDRRNAQWSRERDEMILRAFTQMNERISDSLNLLAEALKRP